MKKVHKGKFNLSKMAFEKKNSSENFLFFIFLFYKCLDEMTTNDPEANLNIILSNQKY